MQSAIKASSLSITNAKGKKVYKPLPSDHARQMGPSSLTSFTMTMENLHPSKYSTAVI